MFIGKKTYSFKKLNQFAIAAVLFLATSLIGAVWIISEYHRHEKKVEKLREDYVAIRKLESKTLVNNIVTGIEFQKDEVESRLKASLSEYTSLAWRISTSIYDQYKDQMETDELQKLIISTLMPLRFFGGRGYFWIHDTNYMLIAHPFREKSIGTNDVELTDSKGQKIIRSFVQAATRSTNDGFVTYYWNKPDVDERHHQTKGQKKIAHLRLFEPFMWVIGIGDYVDDVEQQTKEVMIRRLSAIRHGEKGYIFAHTSDGICLSHIEEKNIGKNRWELEDANGMKVVQELNRVGQQPGGGFLEYVGSINPDTGEPAQKISFVRAVDGWGWVIGSGVYSADVEQRLAEYSEKLFQDLKRRLATTVIILVVVLIIGFFIGNLFFKNLLQELNLFVGSSGDDDTLVIDPEQLRISELRTIAERANGLLKEKEQIQTDLARAKRMESIGIMAGGVAHDLNNILSGIVGYPELMLQKLPAESELRKPLTAIHDSGKRASAVVADLLTVARSAASKKDVHALNSLVQEYFNSPEFLKLQSEHPEIVVRQTLSEDSTLILCSPVHIKKCLMNLVANAAEAIDGAGEITVTTSVRHIGDSYLHSPDQEGRMHVCVTVCDTGPGISASDLEHIFEPFYTKKAMGKSGTGLGLAIVWNTVENHGGRIKAESSENGTCFSLIFPLVTDSQSVESKESNIAMEKRIGNNEKLLVIDDEPYLRDIACQILEDFGYNVNSVSSGELAIEYVRENRVDLLVLDMLMEPGMNGRETYEKIKQIQPDIRAVITSGFSEDKEVQEALRLGVKGYIQKPYSINQLGEVIQDALR